MGDAAPDKVTDLKGYVYGLPTVDGASPKLNDLVTIHCSTAAAEPIQLPSLVPNSDGAMPADVRCSDDFSQNDSFKATPNYEDRRKNFSECESDRELMKAAPDSQTPSTGTTGPAAGRRCDRLVSLEVISSDTSLSASPSSSVMEYERDADMEEEEKEEDFASNHSIIPWLFDLEADEDQCLLDSEDSGSELKFDRCVISRCEEEPPVREIDDVRNYFETTKNAKQERVQGREESDGSCAGRGITSANNVTSVNDVKTGRCFLSDDCFRVMKTRSRLSLTSSSASGSQDSSASSPDYDRLCPTIRICKTTPGFLRINPRDVEAEADKIPTGGRGRAFLSRTLDQVRRRLIDDLSPLTHSYEDDLKEIESAKLRSTYLKNLLVLSVGFMFVFTSFWALRNLQSSINDDGGLGLAALSCMNATFALGCIFATSIVQRVRPKRAIMLSLVGQLLFTVANIRATFYTLLPATAVVGFTMATLLVAQGTYLTSIAVTYAAVSGKKHDHIVSLFNGFFLFMLQISQIFGNLISSTVFSFLAVEKYEKEATAGTGAAAEGSDEQSVAHEMDHKSTSFRVNQTQNLSLTGLEASTEHNGSLCGSEYCHMFLIESPNMNIYEDTFVILVAILCLVSATGMVVIGLLLDKLDVIFHKSKQGLVSQLCAIVRLHRDRRMRLSIPLMTFLGIQEAFVYAEFTKAYVTCRLGLHMIGYVMMCFAGCASLTSVTVGYAQKYLHRSFIIVTGAICHLTLMTVLYLWQPSSNDTVAIFLIAGGLGVVDGTWQTVICSLCGVLFDRRHREASFSSLRMYQSLGLCLALGYAQFLCTDVKIAIMAGVLLSALVAYFALGSCDKTNDDDREAREPASI